VRNNLIGCTTKRQRKQIQYRRRLCRRLSTAMSATSDPRRHSRTADACRDTLILRLVEGMTGSVSSFHQRARETVDEPLAIVLFPVFAHGHVMLEIVGRLDVGEVRDERRVRPHW